MMPRLPVLLLSILGFFVARSQAPADISRINKAVASIDSMIAVGIYIGKFIRPVINDDGGQVFLKHHFIIDTTKKILYKAVYEYVHYEQVAFYYEDQKIIKAIIGDTLENHDYSCEYFFRNSQVFSSKEHGLAARKNSWSKKSVISVSRQYLDEFEAICRMLDQRKQ